MMMPSIFGENSSHSMMILTNTSLERRTRYMENMLKI